MKPKYRVLISTRGRLCYRNETLKSTTYNKWIDIICGDIDNDVEIQRSTTQVNQVNYFIPISK